MDSGNLREYEALSPFEIKDLLASLATRSARASAKTYLDAGRGNPNWNATSPREAFFLLGQFAIAESKRVLDRPPGIGGTPQASGIAARLAAWLDEQAGASGASLLRAMLPWAIRKFGFDPDSFVYELVDAVLGDNYPVPDRMLAHNEQIVHEYLRFAMFGAPRPAGRFKLYAVEGGTAAMCYVFRSLKANRLLRAGDTIALGAPIVTPYLEIPLLEDYGLKTLCIASRQENRFQFEDSELEDSASSSPRIRSTIITTASSTSNSGPASISTRRSCDG